MDRARNDDTGPSNGRLIGAGQSGGESARHPNGWNCDLAQELAQGLAQEISLLRTLCERLQDALLQGLLPEITAPLTGGKARAHHGSTARFDAPRGAAEPDLVPVGAGGRHPAPACPPWTVLGGPTGSGQSHVAPSWVGDPVILGGLQAIDRIAQGLDDLGRVARQLARTPPEGPDGLARAIRLRDLRDRLFPVRASAPIPKTGADRPGEVQLF